MNYGLHMLSDVLWDAQQTTGELMIVGEKLRTNLGLIKDVRVTKMFVQALEFKMWELTCNVTIYMIGEKRPSAKLGLIIANEIMQSSVEITRLQRMMFASLKLSYMLVIKAKSCSVHRIQSF